MAMDKYKGRGIIDHIKMGRDGIFTITVTAGSFVRLKITDKKLSEAYHIRNTLIVYTNILYERLVKEVFGGYSECNVGDIGGIKVFRIAENARMAIDIWSKESCEKVLNVILLNANVKSDFLASLYRRKFEAIIIGEQWKEKKEVNGIYTPVEKRPIFITQADYAEIRQTVAEYERSKFDNA